MPNAHKIVIHKSSLGVSIFQHERTSLSRVGLVQPAGVAIFVFWREKKLGPDEWRRLTIIWMSARAYFLVTSRRAVVGRVTSVWPLRDRLAHDRGSLSLSLRLSRHLRPLRFAGPSSPAPPPFSVLVTIVTTSSHFALSSPFSSQLDRIQTMAIRAPNRITNRYVILVGNFCRRDLSPNHCLRLQTRRSRPCLHRHLQQSGLFTSPFSQANFHVLDLYNVYIQWHRRNLTRISTFRARWTASFVYNQRHFFVCADTEKTILRWIRFDCQQYDFDRNFYNGNFILCNQVVFIKKSFFQFSFMSSSFVLVCLCFLFCFCVAFVFWF